MAEEKFRIVDVFEVKSRAISNDALSLFEDAANSNAVLKASIDATHSGRLTNMRVYPGTRVRKSVKSFMEPFAKPVLKHHDDEKDPIGRVSGASFVQLTEGDLFRNDYKNPSQGKGSGFIKLDITVADKDAIQKFLDGRFSTFSTGQSSKHAYCSICGEDLVGKQSFFGFDHDHQPGEYYEMEGDSRDHKGRKDQYLCYIITGDLKYSEVSCVNKPADEYTKVNGFEILEGTDSSATMICAGDGLFASMDSLELGRGGDFVDLMGTVTSKDRQKLTGKTIVAIHPNCKLDLEDDDMPEDNTEVTTEETSEDTKESTTTDSVASDESGSDETGNSDETKDEEGVVAPKSEETEDSTVDGELSRDTLTASLEAVTAQVKALKDEKEELKSQITRVEATVAEKDEELTKMRQTAQDRQVELKTAYATQLLDSRLFLRKADVAEVKDTEAYDEQLQKYAERTLDSLKDALTDLAPEIITFKGNAGVPKQASETVAGDKVDSPVANVSPKDSKTEKPKQLTDDEKLEQFLISDD